MTHAVPLEGESAASTAVTTRSFAWFGLIALVAIISTQALGILTSPPDRDISRPLFDVRGIGRRSGQVELRLDGQNANLPTTRRKV